MSAPNLPRLFALVQAVVARDLRDVKLDVFLLGGGEMWAACLRTQAESPPSAVRQYDQANGATPDEAIAALTSRLEARAETERLSAVERVITMENALKAGLE